MLGYLCLNCCLTLLLTAACFIWSCMGLWFQTLVHLWILKTTCTSHDYILIQGCFCYRLFTVLVSTLFDNAAELCLGVASRRCLHWRVSLPLLCVQISFANTSRQQTVMWCRKLHDKLSSLRPKHWPWHLVGYVCAYCMRCAEQPKRKRLTRAQNAAKQFFKNWFFGSARTFLV